MKLYIRFYGNRDYFYAGLVTATPKQVARVYFKQNKEIVTLLFTDDDDKLEIINREDIE